MDPHDKVMFCGNDNAYSNAELDHYAQQAVDTFLNAYAPTGLIRQPRRDPLRPGSCGMTIT
jgi:hypothetical protein